VRILDSKILLLLQEQKSRQDLDEWVDGIGGRAISGGVQREEESIGVGTTDILIVK
jgi:hypothetical protein